MGRKSALLLLWFAWAAGAEELDGKIAGGKAKQLVDAAQPAYQEADAIYRAWILDQIPEAELIAQLRKATTLYDGAVSKLLEAIDIQYDPGINHMIRLAARRMTNLRFRTEFRHETPAERTPEAPAPPEKPPPPPEEPDSPPVIAVQFEEAQAPAYPVDMALPLPTSEAAAQGAKANEAAVGALLKEYYQSRRQDKLLYRHTLCGGKGKMRDGSVCEECCGCGSRINLYHFRKAFWGVWSPSLRDAPGALETLRAFHARAQRDPAALGDLVKAFRILKIETHGYWARATVQETTTAGKAERSFTLISVGSRWFFYHPVADAELLPRWRKE